MKSFILLLSAMLGAMITLWTLQVEPNLNSELDQEVAFGSPLLRNPRELRQLTLVSPPSSRLIESQQRAQKPPMKEKLDDNENGDDDGDIEHSANGFEVEIINGVVQIPVEISEADFGDGWHRGDSIKQKFIDAIPEEAFQEWE